jgi:hypothetical protein
MANLSIFLYNKAPEELVSGLTFEHFMKPKYPNIRPDTGDANYSARAIRIFWMSLVPS